MNVGTHTCFVCVRAAEERGTDRAKLLKCDRQNDEYLNTALTCVRSFKLEVFELGSKIDGSVHKYQ